MASIKFLENISFGDNIEIQFGDSTSPEGVIKANNSGLFLSAPVGGTLIQLDCSASGFIAFGYGSSNYFFFMNSISGATEIRFGNVKKFETLSTGVKITGDIQVTGGFKDSSGGLGTSGQVLSSTGTGTSWIAAGAGGTPAGSNTQIQFNDSGAFGADSNLTWNGTDLDIIGNIIGGNTSILYMRQIKLDESTTASAGSNGRGARVFKFGTQALAAGTVYALTSGGWVNAKATQVDLLSTGLLGVATTSTSGDPLLMDGVIYLNNDPGGSIGSVIYLNTTAGSLTNDVSGFTTGNVVRVVGHKVGTNKVYFNPSRDWIEIS
jgi:hypothetical protein